MVLLRQRLLLLFVVNNFTKCAPPADDERKKILLRAEEGSVKFFLASEVAGRITRAAQVILIEIRLLAKQLHRFLLLGALVASWRDNLAILTGGSLIDGVSGSARGFAHGQGRFARFLVEYK